MRTEFEKLPEIEKYLRLYCFWDSLSEQYHPNNQHDNLHDLRAEYVNGAWWMYQELHNSLGFVKGGHIRTTKYDIASILGGGCFEHFKNAIATDGTKIGTTEKLNVSQPYTIDKINLECNDIIHLTSIKEED